MTYIVMYKGDDFASVTGPFTDYDEATNFRTYMERRFGVTFSMVNEQQAAEEFEDDE